VAELSSPTSPMSYFPAHMGGSQRPGGERALGVPPAIDKKDPNYICEREGEGEDFEGSGQRRGLLSGPLYLPRRVYSPHR